ncbi:hypothetical protein [Jiangella endophytica]|uniref:hypothetical protein n=1 Tax=Jiangella endophytica TaxID=1623398 RepID=UPI000E34B79A|nr:hypothetical protein [Jiangella endophytica]
MTEFLAAAGRRWYILLLGLLLTAGLGVGAAALSPPTYSARGLVLLLPPAESVGVGGNPFLALGALDMPARIIVSYLDSPSARAGVEDAVPTAHYDVSMEEATRGPVIAIEVSDSTPDGALTTLQDIADAVPATLARLQQELDVPAASSVTSMPLTMSTEAGENIGGTVRAVVVAVGAGLVLTVAAVVLTDRLVLRSASRRRAMPRSRTDTEPAVPERPSGPGPDDDTQILPRPAGGARRRAR